LLELVLVNNTDYALYFAVRSSADVIADQEFVDKLVFFIDKLSFHFVSKVHRMLKKIMLGDSHGAFVFLSSEHVQMTGTWRLC